ncbi:hypothetical protein B0J13DRAFT_654511 [Dactylonectria estremocensis]|uniref:Uncharacterized protein n=1 Tax=Dactylonectria estremocensis TaxID=1079267 RepID=A0A9P9F7Y6_9HYPO|nr:hypothetical protein B0J13DRAFT_654511 [Dactylonectria estremocensis]
MACHLTPALPSSRFSDKGLHVPVSGLTTPPDSPVVDEFIARCQTPIDCSLDVSYNPSAIVECGVVYPVSKIRAMAIQLAQARDNGEIPYTTTPCMDSQAIIEDYESLMVLRDARGDYSEPTPAVYKQLRVEIARRILERDASIEENKCNAEAVRRVNSYIRSVQQEELHFHVSSDTSRQPSISGAAQLDIENVSEELCSIVEQTIEQTLSDATGPLRLNVGNLHKENATFSNQNSSLARQIDMHYRVLEQQTKTNAALLSMFDPQSKNMQAASEQLTATTEQLAKATENVYVTGEYLNKATKIVHATDEQLAVVTSLTNLLSQVVMNLPCAINEVVNAAVQQQTQDSFKDILEAQQKVIMDLEIRSRKIQAMAAEVEVCRLQVADRGRDLRSTQHACGTRPQGLGRRGEGKMRKIMKKVFGSQL